METPEALELPDYVDATKWERKELLKLLKEQVQRSTEALRLYQPLPFQQAYHECFAKECIIMKGNRAGGSLAGFAEDARAVTDQDPFKKYAAKDGVCVCLGFGEKHIGRVIHKFLFRAGSFRIIRDEETNQWRVFRPWTKDNGGDYERIGESEPAPPLIAPRFISHEDMAWEKRAEHVFNIARCEQTGWEIYALNSNGDPSQAQGFDVDLYHIDEDTARPGWYEEAIGRTAIPEGLIRWTALPHSKNDDILGMIDRANEEQDKPNPTTVCVRASMFDNPYYPEKSKQENIKIWASQGEDILRKRAYGELVLDSVLMYPTFSKQVHGLHQDTRKSKAQLVLEANGGEPPSDWCLDVVVDPGHTVCAGVFFCTPPPVLGRQHFVYDEFYLRQADAERFGEAMEQKLRGRAPQRFIIDAHGGRLREIGSGITPQRQYEKQLEKRNISCVETGHYFVSGSDDVAGRETKLREWFRMTEAGYPMILFSLMRAPNTVRELERFKKKTRVVNGQNVPLDEGNRSANTHAVECVEYAAAHGLKYVAPPSNRVHNSYVKRILEARKQRAQRRRFRHMGMQEEGINLGPQGD